MTLASQMARADRMSGSWGGTSKRKRRRPAAQMAAIAGAGVIVLTLVVWGGVQVFSGPTEGNAADPKVLDGAAPVETSSPESAKPEGGRAAVPVKREEPSAIVLEMGRDPMKSRGAIVQPDTGGETETMSAPPVPISTPAPALAKSLTEGNPAKTSGPTNTGSTGAPGPGTAAPGTGGQTGLQTPASATPKGTPAGSPTATAELQQLLSAAERAQKENRVVDARATLNRALLDPGASEADKEAIRRWASQLNESLVFSPAVTQGDSVAETYTIAKGDSLAKITSRLGLGIDWRALQRINRLADPGRIQVGQKIKVLRGPFHAVVDKSAFRLDLYAGEPVAPSAAAKPSRADGMEPGWIYIRSYSVGLGEKSGTPTATFMVKPKSKLLNPHWVNPRTGEKFSGENPKNPIGEHWLGLEGLDETSKMFAGYGLHGTIQPESIGKEMSMGCVRMGADDISQVWELLEEGVSVVRIVP
ncbi:MAG: LysM peptidoglycan-binding domain-containing protein [Phycisphaerales bacterium]|nr:LysM peptidoglycan-binding domain-containing protein [Phycisphaerales bacterium]